MTTDSDAPPGEGGVARPVLVAAPDKFRGTVSAAEAASAIAAGAQRAGWAARTVPLADGGEGFLDAFVGPAWRRRTASVTGPSGVPVEAAWLLGDGTAVVESALASGLALAGGAESNDPWEATSTGTGELVARAAAAVGAGGTVLVGIGGTACTDGGWGAVRAVVAAGGLRGASLIGAADVAVPFLDAARRFGAQKGAAPAVVDALATRLVQVADRYRHDTAVDVLDAPGAGAGGGLGGGILALGGRIRPGFGVVAERVGLADALEDAALVVTGEGQLDRTTFDGKVVGEILDLAAARGLPAAAVVGRATPEGRRLARSRNARVVDLTEAVGPAAAVAATARWLADAVERLLGSPR